jgi:hypothetical protein
MEVRNNVSVSNFVYASGGSGGAASGSCGAGAAGSNGLVTVSYCANGTGMDWSKFTPAAANATIACQNAPTVSFTVPNSSSSVTANLQNLSTSASPSNANITWVFEISSDNRTTWLPMNASQLRITSNSTNASPILDTHRLANQSPNRSVMRAYAYNNTSQIFSPFTYSSNFNISPITSSVVANSSPFGTVSTNAVTFYCNYTNTSSAIEAADAQIILDGVIYNLSYNTTDGRYYYVNNNTWTGGDHSWNCIMGKANYQTLNSSPVNITLAGFSAYLASGQTYVKLTCPFPTIPAMTPAGQKGLVGIIRIQNNNATSLKNYSIFLNNSLPSGISVFARSGSYVGGISLSGWTALSTTTGYQILTNLDSTNTSAYIWLRMDCIDAAPGAYVPFGYAITET